MTNEELLNLINNGSLNQVEIAQEQLIHYLNLGLKELYLKYNISNSSQIITGITGITKYPLNPNVLQVESVWTIGAYFRDKKGLVVPQKEDFELELNVIRSHNNAFTNTINILTITNAVTAQPFTVYYKVLPMVVTFTNLTVNLDIPSQYESALVAYITYLGFMQINGGSQEDTQVYFARYIEACRILNTYSVTPRIEQQLTKFEDKGFV